MLLTNTLVPAALVLLGPRIDLGRMPFTAKLDSQRAASTGNRWRQWGRVIVAHPWLALFIAGTPLLLLAWQVRRLDTSLPRGDWLPQAAESVHALHTLERMDRGGVVESLRVIVEFPTDSIAQGDAGWDALDRLSKRLASDPRSDRVISITTLAQSNRASLTDLSRETRRTFLSSDGRAALLEVLPASSVSCATRSTACGSCVGPARQLLPVCLAQPFSLAASRHSTLIMRRLSETAFRP